MYHNFTKEFNFFLSEQRVLCNLPNGKTTFITASNTTYVLHSFSFVECSEFSENILMGKTQLDSILHTESFLQKKIVRSHFKNP